MRWESESWPSLRGVKRVGVDIVVIDGGVVRIGELMVGSQDRAIKGGWRPSICSRRRLEGLPCLSRLLNSGLDCKYCKDSLTL